MSTPEEIAVQEAAASAAAAQAAQVDDPAKKAEADAAKATEDAAKAAEESQRAEEARVAEEARKAAEAEPLSEGAKTRIQKLIAEREEARRDAEYQRGRAEARQPRQPEPDQPTPLKIEDFLPNEAEFSAVGLTAENFEKLGRSYDDLLMAKSAFAMQKRTDVLAHRADEGRAKESVAKAHAAFMDRINKAAETDPDLPRIVDARDARDPYFVPISQAMAEVIRDSEVGPKLLRHLANNKADATRLASLPPMSAARELGRIEAKILATPTPDPPKRVSQAPEPMRSLTPSGVTEIDLDKVPIDDFMKKRNAQQYGATGR